MNNPKTTDEIICDENTKFRICTCNIMQANAPVNNPDYDRAKTIYDFRARSIKGEVIPLENYTGLVCLFVNIATKAKGLSDYNFDILNRLYDLYYPNGLRILGFPCNQFNNEEPGDAFAIMRYAAEKQVKWDLFEKTDVNGVTACELFKFIKNKAPGERGMLLIKSNFTKFVVNRAGLPVLRLPSDVTFEALEKELLEHLGLSTPVIPQEPYHARQRVWKKSD